MHEYTLKLCPAHKIDLDMIGRLEKVEDKRTRSVVDDTSLTSQKYIHTAENGPSDFSNVGVVLQQTEDPVIKNIQQPESRQIAVRERKDVDQRSIHQLPRGPHR